MKTLTKALLAAGLMAAAAGAHAFDYSFTNVSVNYLDWTNSTESRTQAVGKNGNWAGKYDFAYLEFEGGKGGDWGDIYGFYDVEQPYNNTHMTDGHKDRRYAGKFVARYKLADLGNYPLMAYGHIYDFRDADFFDQNRVLGLSTNLQFGGLWIHPFLGVHQELKSGLGANRNGYMGGWVLGYNFKAFGQDMMVSNWHETEFARKDMYDINSGSNGDMNHTSFNGAVSLWWNVNKTFTTGVSYRYASDKLGYNGYQDALIYTAKYNF